METLNLNDLYNPNGIISIHVKDGSHICADHQTHFQEYPKVIELWQKVDAGLHKLAAWRKSSVTVAQYSDTWNEEVDYFEILRPYIQPVDWSKE